MGQDPANDETQGQSRDKQSQCGDRRALKYEVDVLIGCDCPPIVDGDQVSYVSIHSCIERRRLIKVETGCSGHVSRSRPPEHTAECFLVEFPI